MLGNKSVVPWPGLKIITHHAGAFVPYYEERITAFQDLGEMQYKDTDRLKLTLAPIDY